MEIKAQIKLRFKGVNGQQMVCIRSLQLTQKKTKMEQKALEGLLIVNDSHTGEVATFFYFKSFKYAQTANNTYQTMR